MHRSYFNNTESFAKRSSPLKGFSYFTRGGKESPAEKSVKSEKGMALLMVILVIVLLMGIVSQFALSMRTGLTVTRNMKEENESYFLALSGIKLGMMEVLQRTRHTVVNEKGTLLFAPHTPFVRTHIPLGSGFVDYIIEDESGKANLNALSAEQANLLFIQGVADAQKVKELSFIPLTDEFTDWRDPDNKPVKETSAEDDYYLSLPPHYESKDSSFDFIDELLLLASLSPWNTEGLKAERSGKASGEVRDVQGNRAVSGNGDEEEGGLTLPREFFSHLFTVSPYNPLFSATPLPHNGATAPLVVLDALYGKKVTDDIEKRRKDEELVGASAGERFTIRARGYFQGSPLSHSIQATVHRAFLPDTSGKSRLTIIVEAWNDNLIDE